MQSSNLVLVTAVFLASAVEMVEALTIVVAAGTTRGWRSAFEGVAVAILALAVLVVALGPAIVVYVPLPALRIIVGGVLLVFGLQWVRKAVLRAAGLKAKHDEDAIFEEEVASLSAPVKAGGRDALGFTVAFKGVFLEGMEVVIVVLTLGATAHNLGLAAVSALAAAAIVAAVGVVVARQLAGIPENAMKMGVGLMLVGFGTFWTAEGLGVSWPGSDLAIPVLVVAFGLVAWLFVRILSGRRQRAGSKGAAGAASSTLTGPARWLAAFGRFWWDFLVGDTPELFVGTIAVILAVFLMHRLSAPVSVQVVALPLLTCALLGLTLRRAVRQT